MNKTLVIFLGAIATIAVVTVIILIFVIMREPAATAPPPITQPPPDITTPVATTPPVITITPAETTPAETTPEATTPAATTPEATTPATTPTPTTTPAAASGVTIPDNIVPRAPERADAPTSPAISAQQAAELARDYLNAAGVTDARFDYIYMDREDGRWVWSVEFDGRGRDFEFYIDVETGEFLRMPQIAGGGQDGQPPTPAGTPAETQAAGNWRGPGRAPDNWPAEVNFTAEQAVEIALTQVAGEVREVDHDFERGRAAWWVEIRAGNRTHEFKIDVMTGEILDYD